MAENTFLGLQPYTEADAYRFKGRTEESQELFRLIVRNDYTVCYAESGEGKTSLLNAGVFPLLRQNMFFPIAITFTNDDYRHSPDSFDTIIDRCIKDSIADYNEKNKGIDIEYKLCSTDFQGLDCQTSLQQALSQYSWWKLRNYKPQAMGLTFTPVFVFDQFEEVFNLPCSIVWTKKFFDWLEDVSSDSCPEDIVNKVREIIGTSSAFPAIKEEKGFKAVFSLRKEYIGELDYWGMQKCFIPSLKDNRYCLKALTYEGAKNVMTQQQRFEVTKVEQALHYFVLQYSREPEKTIAENLPAIPALLLSVVCDSWEKDIDFFSGKDESEIGKSLNRILERFYDEAISSIVNDLSQQESNCQTKSIREDIEVAIFALVDSNGKRVRRKSSELSHLDFDAKYKEILSENRIIKISKVDGEDYVDLVHDALCTIIAERKENKIADDAKKRILQTEEENRRIKMQNDKLNKIRSLFLSEKAYRCQKDRYMAQMLALEALPKDIDYPDKPLVPKAEAALRMTYSIPYCPMNGHDDIVSCVMSSSDGTQVVSLSRNSKVSIWDAFSGTRLKEHNCGVKAVSAMSTCENGNIIVASYSNGVVHLKSFDNFEIVDEFPLHVAYPKVLTIGPDGGTLAIGIEDGYVILYKSGQEMLRTQSSIKTIDVLTISPDSEELIAIGEGRMEYCSVKTGEWNCIGHGVISTIACASYSENGKVLFCGTENGKIIVLKSRAGSMQWKDIIECENSDCRINAISSTKDAKRIAYSVGGKLMVLDRDSRFGWSQQEAIVQGGECHIVKTDLLKDEFAPIITSIAWSPDGRYVIWGNVEGAVSMFDTNAGPRHRELLKAKSFMKALKYGPHGNQLFCISNHSTLRVIDIKSGKELKKDYNYNKKLHETEFLSDDGNYLAVCNNHRHVVELYRNNKKTESVFAFEGEVTSIVFNSDSTLLAIAQSNGSITCWDILKNDLKYVLNGYKSKYNTAQFSPNGEILVITAPKGDVTFWNEKSGGQKFVIPSEAENGYVYSLAFSPDGERLAIGTESGKIRIWNVDTKKQVELLDRNKDGLSVKCMAFSPDGNKLSASYSDGTIVVWSCPSLKSLIEDVRKKMKSRKFTDEEKERYYIEDD